LSGRGLCDELITRPEESYRLCCVVVCDLETSRMGAPYIYDISHLRVKQSLKYNASIVFIAPIVLKKGSKVQPKKMQRFLHLFISTNCSICFRRFLRPSSGAQNCTYSVRYCQTNTAACCYRGSTISAGSSIGLTIPDAVCTVLCS